MMRAALVLGVATLGAGCTEPLLVADAGVGADCLGADCGVADAAADDSFDGLTPEASIPTPSVRFPSESKDWIAALRGRYAMRARSYGRLGTAQRLDEFIALAEIKVDGQRVWMETTLCRDRSELRPPIEGNKLTSTVVYPADYAVKSFPIVYDQQDGQFVTTKAPTRIGFVEVVVGCSRPGEKVPSQASAQPWLRGEPCTCPTSEAVPRAADDCRLYDPDNDNVPGISVRVAGTHNGVDAVALKDSSQLLHGKIDTKNFRHSASYDIQEEYVQLSCAGGRPCERNAPFSPCHLDNNKVDFVPIDDGLGSKTPWGCVEILKKADEDAKFFSDRPLEFPTGC